MYKICALIPSYNHYRALPEIINRLRSLRIPIYIVDDGSNIETQGALDRIVDTAAAASVQLLRFPQNKGKGGAILAGLQWINSLGYTHALQVDADGQHSLDTLDTFLDVSGKNPKALISGQPIYDKTVPKMRQLGRWLTHVWVWIETLSFRITDSMCGFRIYPVQKTLEIMETKTIGRRMEFDTDVMVHLFWSGTPVIMLPLQVTYPEGNPSNFNMVKDNWRITKMHTRLFFTMLRDLPTIIRNRPDYKCLIVSQEKAHWSSLAERGSLKGLFFLARCYRLLGKRLCTYIGVPVVLSHYVFGKIQRRASKVYLTRVFQRKYPGKSPTFRDSFRHYMTFFEMALDKLAAWVGDITLDQLNFRGSQNLSQIMGEDNGGMLLVSHLGNMEFCRAVASGAHKSRLHILLHTKNAQRFNQLLKAFNPLSTMNIIEVTEIGPDTILYLKDCIAQGDWVVITGDRLPVHGAGRVVTVPFLGKEAPFSQGPYILASLLACPVYTAFAMREGKQINVYVDLLTERLVLDRQSKLRGIKGYASQYAAQLEKYALLYPYQWFNFFDFWQENTHMKVNGNREH